MIIYQSVIVAIREKLYECKAKVMQSMDYLQSLLNNVLDIGKVESGTLQLVNKPFDLVAMLVKTDFDY